MPKCIYVEHDGTEHVVEADIGVSVMATAVKHQVSGIVAECGGACSCATCHVYVDDAWRDKLARAQDMEESMLEFAYERKHNSRLSCQIAMTAELDGLVVRLPKSQGWK